jgi:hypothetical protein
VHSTPRPWKGRGVKSPWFACAVAWALARDLPGGVAFQGCFFNHRGHRGHRGGAGDFLCLLSTFYFLLSMAGMPLPPHPRPLSACGGEGRILCFQLSVASLGGFFSSWLCGRTCADELVFPRLGLFSPSVRCGAWGELQCSVSSHASRSASCWGVRFPTTPAGITEISCRTRSSISS